MKPCNRSRALSAFAISAIGDEIASNLGEQLDHLASMGVGYIELRSAWGKNVLDLTPGEVARAVRLISDRHMAVSAIASSVGKAPIDESLDIQIARLETALIRAAQFGAEYVRIFSFYVPSCERKRHAAEIVRRLSLFAEMAFRAGITLLLENDCDLFGEHPAEARFLVERVNSPCLRLLFDPGNYVMKGLRPFDQAWPCVADYVRYIHVKDATLADLSPCLPGQGDGQIPALLSDLKARGYTGFLSLEPHLVVAGPSGGFSGPAPFARALHSLRHLIASQ